MTAHDQPPSSAPHSASSAGHPAARTERASLKALRPLVPFALRYKGRIVAALIALVMASMATLIIPLAVRRMIDYGFSSSGADLIDRYFLVMIAVVTLLAVASASRYYLVMTLGERVVADIRMAVFDHLTRLDAAFYDMTRSGEIVSRLTADTTQIKSAFGSSASIALRNFVLFIGAITMMLITSPHLSGLVLVAIPVIVLPLVLSGRSVRRRSRDAQDRLADASAFATEAIGAMQVTQAFTAEKATRSRFNHAVDDAFTTARDSTRARALLTAVAIFLIFTSVVGVLWWGAQDVLNNKMSGGRLSQFVLYAVFSAGALGELSQVWGEISAAAGAAGRLADILSITPRIETPAAPLALPDPPLGTLAFNQVGFAYPGRPEQPVLHSVSFALKQGERVALVGPSGAGKSTVMQLILRFYDADRGEVRIDGCDVRAVDPHGLRSRLSYVPQESVIFAATIRENIRFGRPEATDGEIEQAARLAEVDRFVRDWPEGYATMIGERGVTLSGGQRQRIAIARAILRNEPILLLDEATSALDAESETLVQAALDGLMEGRTTLVIAHRLATVLGCDRILVMDQGRIVEEGSHGDLIAKGGLYARLAELQFNQSGKSSAIG